MPNGIVHAVLHYALNTTDRATASSLFDALDMKVVMRTELRYPRMIVDVLDRTVPWYMSLGFAAVRERRAGMWACRAHESAPSEFP